ASQPSGTVSRVCFCWFFGLMTFVSAMAASSPLHRQSSSKRGRFVSVSPRISRTYCIIVSLFITTTFPPPSKCCAARFNTVGLEPGVATRMLIGHPDDVRRLSVYQYHFLDDLSFVRKPEEVFDESKQADLDAYIDGVRQHLKDAGWEGDGKIGIIWLPPFVDAGGVEDTWGTYIWHVKQSNNGTSWLASDAALDFDRLGEQNERWPSDTHVRTGIMFTACIGLTRRVKQIMSDLTRRVKALDEVSNPVLGEIKEELLITTQGELVAQLNYFLDDCYLDVLMEVLKNGNTSALPLGKFKASFNPKVYLPTEEDSERDDPEAGQWFTIQGLIRDIWWSYKFEPFDSKTSMLFKACEYLPPQEIQR